MSDKEKQELQILIPSIEQNVEKLENLEQKNENAKEQIQELKQKLEYLKNIAWDRQSKMEREQMLKVLKGKQESTEVKSKVGDIVIDTELTEKLKKKHLDDPKLRGMITSDEFLSFPKVAKNVEAEYNEEYQGHTWKVKADDESIIAYGSREYEIDGKEVNRLLTTHSKTDMGGRRQSQADRVSSAIYFNDPDSRGSVRSEIIPQNKDNTNEKFSIFTYLKDGFLKLSTILKSITKQKHNQETFIDNKDKKQEFKPEIKEPKPTPQNNKNKDNTRQKSLSFSNLKDKFQKIDEDLKRQKIKNNDESYLSGENLKDLNQDTKDKSLNNDKSKQDNNSNTQSSNKNLRKKQ